jgi:hypothetical protein
MAGGVAILLVLLEAFYISWTGFIIGTTLFLVLGVILILFQRFRLRMEVVDTVLSQKQLNAILRNVGRTRGWVRYRDIKECYVARIPRPRGGRGEMVTVLFGENKVFINSIPEPKGDLSISKYRRNRNNIHILRRVIRNRQTGH